MLALLIFNIILSHFLFPTSEYCHLWISKTFHIAGSPYWLFCPERLLLISHVTNLPRILDLVDEFAVCPIQYSSWMWLRIVTRSVQILYVAESSHMFSTVHVCDSG